MSSSAKINLLLIGLVFLLVGGLTLFKLSESPRTWMDEGILLQVAKNTAEQGRFMIQAGPGELVSAGFVSTGCSVLCPIALVFKVFGVSLVNARLVMAGFILALFAVVYLLWRDFIKPRPLILAFLLLATFAPIYGHGRNVLGEIPGLFYLASAVYFLYLIDLDRQRSIYYLIWFSLAAGLAVTTKPIFLLLLPGLVVVAGILFKRGVLTPRRAVVSLGAFILPIVLWYLTQFSGDSLASIFNLYANPHVVDTKMAIMSNLRSFVTAGQPFYMLVLWFIWSLALLVKLQRKQTINLAEAWLWAFTSLVLLAYLRMPGYYRYFFLGQFWALVYLVPSIETIIYQKKIKIGITVILIILVVFQLHQTVTNSWVANYLDSTTTADLSQIVPELAINHSVLLYQTPELVTFLPHNNYWQYLKVTPSVVIGENNLKLIEVGIPDLVFTPNDNLNGLGLIENYQLVKNIDRFTVWSKLGQ